VWPINVNKGLLVLRLVVGLLFIGHGTQKLFGWFGGDGIAGFAAILGNAGIEPPPPAGPQAGQEPSRRAAAKAAKLG